MNRQICDRLHCVNAIRSLAGVGTGIGHQGADDPQGTIVDGYTRITIPVEKNTIPIPFDEEVVEFRRIGHGAAFELYVRRHIKSLITWRTHYLSSVCNDFNISRQVAF